MDGRRNIGASLLDDFVPRESAIPICSANVEILFGTATYCSLLFD